MNKNIFKQFLKNKIVIACACLFLAAIILIPVFLLCFSKDRSGITSQSTQASGSAALSISSGDTTEDDIQLSMSCEDAAEDTSSPHFESINELYAGAALATFGTHIVITPDDTDSVNALSTNAQSMNAQSDSNESDDETGELSEYANLAIANVNDYVNVRSHPGTDGEILGKLYDGSVAEIKDDVGNGSDLWFHIVSGKVEGYIKAEFFIYGDAAANVIDEYVIRYAKVEADRLNVRSAPDTSAKRIGYLDNGEKIRIIEDLGDWLKVAYTEEKEGYIASEYTSQWEEFSYAISIEEEREIQRAQAVLTARNEVSEESAPEQTTYSFDSPNVNYSSNEELRSSIVEYAMQYLGNKYVHGGQSLSGGTDCSGFTCYVYAEFGYSISRTPSGQYSSDGRSISADEAQPGDIICYSSSGGKCTHVGLYIGGGQIIHEANSKKGVIISDVGYETIIGIKNVID